MESLRTTALQRELTRIEDEAREHSLAAMGHADALEAAEQLCVLLNAGLEPNKSVKTTVVYYDEARASVVIYTHSIVAEVLRRADEAELEWTNHGAFGSEAYKQIAVAGFDGVHLIVEHHALESHLANRTALKVAA